MKLLIHGDGETAAGGERQVALLCAELVRRGHQVVVGCPEGEFAELVERGGAATTRIRPRGNLDLFSTLQFSRWIRAEKPDAVLLTSWKRMLVAGYAARLARAPRIVQRLGNSKGRGSRTGKLRSSLALERCIDLMIVTSPAVAEWVQNEFSVPPARVRICQSAVQPIGPGPSMLRRELRIGDAPLLVAVGMLNANKNHQLLLLAMAQMPIREAHLAIAGDGPEAARLSALTQELGLSERVHWLGHRHNVPNILRAADAFVQASRHEGTPVAMLEAMSADCAVITTPVAGTEIAIAARQGRPEAGWLFDHDAPDQLAELMSAVLTGARAHDPSVAARVAEARWRIENWYTVTRMADQYEQVLFA